MKAHDYLVQMTDGYMLYSAYGFLFVVNGIIDANKGWDENDGFQFAIDANVVEIPKEVIKDAEPYYDRESDVIGVRYEGNGITLEIEGRYCEGFKPEGSKGNGK